MYSIDHLKTFLYNADIENRGKHDCDDYSVGGVFRGEFPFSGSDDGWLVGRRQMMARFSDMNKRILQDILRAEMIRLETTYHPLQRRVVKGRIRKLACILRQIWQNEMQTLMG